MEKEVCCLLPLPYASGPHHAHQLVALATHLPTSALYKRQVPTLSLPDCALPHVSLSSICFPSAGPIPTLLISQLPLKESLPAFCPRPLTVWFAYLFNLVDSACLGLTCLTRLPVNLPASASDCETTKPCQPSVLWIKLFNSTWLCCTWFLVWILIMGFSATECHYCGLRWWGIGKLWEPDWWYRRWNRQR